MSCDLPVFTKCCFCIPLRPGLMVLAYLRLISAITVLLAVLVSVNVHFGAKELAILMAALALLVSNLVFSIIFVVAIHNNNYRLLRVYYSFSIFSMSLSVLGFFCSLGLLVYLSMYYDVSAVLSAYSVNVITYFVDILLQLYFIAVIRSGILKLKAEEKIRFTNSNGEARVVLDMPIERERDIKYETISSNSESEEEVITKKPLFPIDELKRLEQDS